MDGWKTIASFWVNQAIFRDKLAVSFRQCSLNKTSVVFSHQRQHKDNHLLEFFKTYLEDMLDIPLQVLREDMQLLVLP